MRQKLVKGDNLFELSDEIPQYKNCLIGDIDGYHNRISVNGEELYAGQAVGDLDEAAFRRIQIRETILSHLTKERELFDKGIKVLSLFFIDSVDKYRRYDADGEPEPGDYARIFEQEYLQLRSEFLDLFHPGYNEYLGRDAVEKVHNDYFSVDKKNKLVDPSIKRGKEDDDISA